MYESYWQLSERPFEGCLDSRFYYPGQSHQAALLKLRYAVENHRGGALLAGPAGAGKTLLVNMLHEELDERFRPFARIVYPLMSPQELLAYLAEQLDGRSSAPGDGTLDSVRRIERFLADNAAEGRHAVAVIDEAHLLRDSATFDALRLLLNFEHQGAPAMTLLLVGQPALLPMLERMPDWEQRLDVKCLLRPFDRQQTGGYVAHRLKAAGAERELFAADAVPTLQQLTEGIARQINRLCDLALLVGYAEKQPLLGPEHLEAVSRELVSVAPE
jgi:type II secretory pathway predicted ATPase ExeA